MTSRLSLKEQQATPDDTARTELKMLVRQLVRTAMAAEPGEERGPDDEEIVMDTEVDGARYLLVRMAKPARAVVSLSPREQEIVRMVALGHPNKTIAGVLNISSWTVCTHLRRIFAKLGVTSRAAMIARLAEEGGLRDQVRTPAGAVRTFSERKSL